MSFLTDADLEQYYGKSVSEISPTDTPLEQYVCGGETVCCEECGASLAVRCYNVVYERYDTSAPSVATGFKERAYCESCEIEYVRSRDPVVDELAYQSSAKRVDEREEYVCSDCHQRHPITVPSGDFNYLTAAEVTSHEAVRVSCPCGDSVVISSLDFPSEISCSYCSRVFTFGIECVE